MAPHFIKVRDDLTVTAFKDGSLIINGKIDTVTELLYITQEIQESIGLVVKTDPSLWRGWLGSNK